MCGGERERERMCVCVCVCVCLREREGGSVCVFALCACACGCYTCAFVTCSLVISVFFTVALLLCYCGHQFSVSKLKPNRRHGDRVVSIPGTVTMSGRPPEPITENCSYNATSFPFLTITKIRKHGCAPPPPPPTPSTHIHTQLFATISSQLQKTPKQKHNNNKQNKNTRMHGHAHAHAHARIGKHLF